MVTAVEAAFATVLALGGVGGLGVVYVASQRLDHPAAAPLAKMALFPSLTGLCYAGLVLISDPTLSRLLFAVGNGLFIMAPPYFLVFTIAYTGRSHWITERRRTALIATYAAIGMVYGGWLFTTASLTVSTQNGLTLLVLNDPGLRQMLTLLVAYPPIFVGIGLLGSFLVSSRNMYRKQTAVIFLAIMASVAGNLVFEAGLSPHPGLNLTPVSFAGEVAVISLALYRFEFLNVEPLAPDVVIEEMNDPVLVLDDDDHIIDANPASTTLFDGSDPTGSHIDDLLPGLRTAIERDEEFVPPSGEFATDGGTVSVYDLNHAPISDQYERDRGSVVVFRDVTRRKQRERTVASLQSVTREFLAAESREEVFELTVQAASDVLDYRYSGTMRYDPEDNVLRPAVLSDPLIEAFEQVDADEMVVEPGPSDVWQVFETGEAQVGDPIEPADASNMPIELGGSLLFPLGEHGMMGISAGEGFERFSEEDRQYVEVLAQTTENALDRVQKEAELRESQELLAQRNEQIEFFNGVLRHDLLNGMMVIHGHTDQLLEKVDGEAADHAETIERWSQDIETLARRVRSVSRAVTRDEAVECTEVDIGAALREKTEKVKTGQETVTIEIRPDLSTLPTVQADDLLPAVIENLLFNAVEHNDSDTKEIIVDAEVAPETLTLTIADNGPGIPDEMKETVFEKEVTADRSGSIGFGLYFVRVMVDRYGGTVRFENRADHDGGKTGAVAVLELPRSPE